MSGTDSATQEALRWLTFSKKDLRVALQLIRGPDPSPHHACWLSQQSAEKALKAALVSENVVIPRTHDLNVLRNMLPKGWVIHDANNDLSILSEWAIEARYPGTWTEPTHEDAVMAESKARLIYENVSAKFKQRGMLN